MHICYSVFGAALNGMEQWHARRVLAGNGGVEHSLGLGKAGAREEKTKQEMVSGAWGCFGGLCEWRICSMGGSAGRKWECKCSRNKAAWRGCSFAGNVHGLQQQNAGDGARFWHVCSRF